jgi:hypothetical protein
MAWGGMECIQAQTAQTNDVLGGGAPKCAWKLHGIWVTRLSVLNHGNTPLVG